ncbi:MAG: hypothetical protein SGBAC_006041 [Bacillariaceae sp.]
MPSLFKKLTSSKNKSTGKSKRSNKSGIFRPKKSIDPPSAGEQVLEDPSLTWTSSLDSGVCYYGPAQSEVESIGQSLSDEVDPMTAESSQAEKANETVQMEKEPTNQVVMLPQESEIKNLSDILGGTIKISKESSNRTTDTIIPEDEVSADEYQRKYEAAETIISHQEMDIVAKAEEISCLQSALRAQELQHDAEVKSLLGKLQGQEQEIESLQEELTVTGQLVSQTASMLLKQHSETELSSLQKGMVFILKSVGAVSSSPCKSD